MVKRKRDPNGEVAIAPNGKSRKHDAAQKSSVQGRQSSKNGGITIQIVTGSYERVLHGFTATIPSKALSPSSDPAKDAVTFTDTFLFQAHTSSIRCMALSALPTSTTEKILLATGSTDERINLYSLSTSALHGSKPLLPTLSGTSTLENHHNRELGSLLHHSATVTNLYFHKKSKLLTSAEDNTIAVVSRAKDWSVLSSIKAPIPKVMGRPSGDTAAPGEVPAGINSFALHPSSKLMISVSRGERCMRLWNMETGKKAAALTFERDMLVQVGEGKRSSGEGRKVLWHPEVEGEEFIVGFERGAVVFDLESIPKARIVPSLRTRIQQMHYLPTAAAENVIAVSTDDGRVLFYSTKEVEPAPEDEVIVVNGKISKSKPLPFCKLLGEIGATTLESSGRIKDFEILPVPSDSDDSIKQLIILTASSSGTVNIWLVETADLSLSGGADGESKPEEDGVPTTKQISRLLGVQGNGGRITCLKAFVMTGSAPDDIAAAEADAVNGAEEEDSSSGSEDV
ncbi:WD40 repeat-like protein [Aulographum hederae CBS 113979]|uniref:WD40 repeat-like protein n=1 Tax=Aulographum hederae CBS 113979 TaxID=1176131 RepID=A0A6G1H406_9PEZI|nr:WD40 repeat-like protein [Aulographum hederae CBS 113979]